MDLADIASRWSDILDTAERYGRDPSRLQLVVRADPRIGEYTAQRQREQFTGSCGQVMNDIERLKEVGATELILDFHASARTTDELVDCALQLAEPTLAAD